MDGSSSVYALSNPMRYLCPMERAASTGFHSRAINGAIRHRCDEKKIDVIIAGNKKPLRCLNK